MRMGGRGGEHGRKREKKAHFINFKAKNDSVLIMPCLRTVAVTPAFVDLENGEMTLLTSDPWLVHMSQVHLLSRLFAD